MDHGKENSKAERERVLELRGKLSCDTALFPSSGAGAYCSFRSQTIHLLETRSATFKASVKDRNFAPIRDDIATVFHEMTHWCDCLGSIWGQNHLLHVFSAYDVVLNRKAESDFWAVVSLYDAERRINRSQYYKTVSPTGTSASAHRPWQFGYSAGREFDPYGGLGDRPILFVRFLDHDTGALAVRQPLTVGAVLETSAMWSEIAATLETLLMLKEDERLVESAIWTRKLMRYMYDPSICEYTAPAHILSAQCGIKDVIATYRHAALLAQVALNFPEQLLIKLEIDGFPEEVNQSFRKFADPGFVYAALCKVAPPSTPDANAEDWLDETLAKARLPGRKEILADAGQKMAALHRSIPPVAEVARHLIELGIEIHGIRSNVPDPGLTMVRVEESKMVLPPVFDMDGDIMFFSKRLPDPEIWHPVHMYEFEAILNTWMRNFISACR